MATAPDSLSPALERVLEKFAGVVRRVCWRYHFTGAEVDELLQEVRIRLWHAHGSQDRPHETIAAIPASYLHRTALSAAVDLLRRRRARRADRMIPIDDEPEGMAEAAGPDLALAESELAEQVERAVLSIQASRRPVVRMHLMGHPREEIARLLGWSESKTRNLLYRGLADVRERLLAEGGPMEQLNATETERLQQLYSRRVAGRPDGSGSACVSPEAILAVVRREGSEEQRLATLEHVMACAACHREYEWLTAVDQAGLEAAGSTVGGSRPWWRGAPLALAASVAVAAGAAVVLSGVLRTGSDRERGAAGDIGLVAPGARAAAAGPLTFAWRALPGGASRYVLEVQRSDGTVAFADTTADTTATLADPSRLSPDSAYRWWVREATEGTEPRSSAFRDLRLTGH